MPTFSLVIEYLTGYSVATDPTDREQPEWPPHPARVFMALAAAHFETDESPAEKAAEREALEWLAALDPPSMTVPECSVRDARTVYVPVNDQACGEALLRRSRQPRLFPRVHLGTDLLRQTWRISNEVHEKHLDALEAICQRVTRIGHSSSLVWVRLEREVNAEPNFEPDEHASERRLRVVQAGALQRLEDAFNQSAIGEYAALDEEIQHAKGKTRKALQGRLAERFPRGRPTSQRPVFSIGQGYRRVEPLRPDVPHTPFDPNLIVLRKVDDTAQAFGLESTAAIMQALRGLLMRESRVQPVPSWAGGHEPNGGKLESGPHIALIPLASVGRPWVGVEQHADGHLMGIGIVLPRSVPLADRGRVLAPILFDGSTNEPRTLELKMGRTGVWKVVRDTTPKPKRTLDTETYTAASSVWASVTPVLLDRMPKTDRMEEPEEWRREVAETLARSCAHLFSHLAEDKRPVVQAVRVEKTPFFRGSLRAMPGQGGFPQLRGDKFQVHCQIEFDRLVQGPVLLGAGRFRGYGLMRPWKNEEVA